MYEKVKSSAEPLHLPKRMVDLQPDINGGMSLNIPVCIFNEKVHITVSVLVQACFPTEEVYT